MSNAITYDPLLVRYLAEELDGLLRGRACASTPYFAAGRVAMLPLDRGEALELDLHPRRGWIRVVPWEADAYETDAFCRGVEAPPDERRMTIHVEAPDRFRSGERRLEVELQTNQWNVLMVSGEDERIHSALWGRRAGTRALLPGAEYRPPPPGERMGSVPIEREAALREWIAQLGAEPPGDRRRALVRSFAYTGSVNDDWILGGAGQDENPLELEHAFARWWSLLTFPAARPVLLTGRPGLQPYPFALAEWPAEPVESLQEAMERVARAGDRVQELPTEDPLLGAARLRLEAARRRVQRLEQEQTPDGEADRLRARADLLLAKLHEVPKGAAEVVLDGWEGEEVRMELDASRSAAENAAGWYAEARKRTRAAERLPALVEKARRELERWQAAVALGERGALPEWVAREVAESGDAGGARSAGESRPYRLFRSSGGLEVRVGRSARANDRLTFGHSSPNDVWLHARSVAGSHVILRWPDPEGAPPGRDLEEAAGLAAYFSKARSSAFVPVDWTRRKYVRKPRGATPGAVIPQRVKTVFVEPRLRSEE